MKKNLTSIMLLLAVTSLSLTSCQVTNKGYQSSPVISRNVDLDPIKADIEVDEKNKLSGSSKSSYFIIFRLSGDNTMADGINYSTDAGGSVFAKLNPLKMAKLAKLNKVRASAAYKALSKGDYDFLVHPNYTITTLNVLGIYKTYECTVTGYGARYKNFRTEREKTVILESGKELVFPDCEK